eukprot:scaffold776_cov347-Pavlova_lutheri.AAC.73
MKGRRWHPWDPSCGQYQGREIYMQARGRASHAAVGAGAGEPVPFRKEENNRHESGRNVRVHGKQEQSKRRKLRPSLGNSKHYVPLLKMTTSVYEEQRGDAYSEQSAQFRGG